MKGLTGVYKVTFILQINSHSKRKLEQGKNYRKAFSSQKKKKNSVNLFQIRSQLAKVS